MNIDLQIAEDLAKNLSKNLSKDVSKNLAKGQFDNDFAALLGPLSGGDDTLTALHGLIDSWLLAVQKRLDDPRLEHALCIRLCDLSESQTLNLTYRGKDKPTNVLSFPAQLDEQFAHDDMPLGDLAICWPVLVTEAGEQGKQPLHHLAHLLVHGILHLLDYDHEADAQAQIMEALEVHILAELGVENPYN